MKLNNTEGAITVIELLEKVHSDAKIALNFSSPFELLVATILSAQCTDKRVNLVTKTLFKKYRTAEDYANADLNELEQAIRSTGFYRNKAKNIKGCCQVLVKKFGSQVPKTMDELLELPGVARKTANVVLQNAYDVIDGIIVDTHVHRVSQRLGMTNENDAAKAEKDLMKIVPKTHWKRFADLLIFHGRRICTAKKPKCELCNLNKLCPSAFTFT